MKPFATTSKIGFSWRFTSFAFRVTKVTLARAMCGTLSPLIQCELSTRPITFLPELPVVGCSSSAVPVGVSQRVSGPCDVATSCRSEGLPLPKFRHAVSSMTLPSRPATESSVPW